MSEPLDKGRQRARRWAIFLTGGLGLAVAGALIGSAVIVTNPTAGPTATPSADGDLQVVEYESPSAAGDDPFTTAADVEGEDVIRFTPASGSASDPNEPYGGSGSLHVCDREALVDFLVNNKDERRAWAGVLGIDSDKESVSRYVRSLTPVTLTVDTRVTNHDFVNGRAVPFQSILAAGTAVLVDKYGRPVVRCKCGNPLTWPKNYPKIRCKGCPPDYKPPKPCKWRIYDPWYPYPPEYLPPEWRDPYPKDYPKPKPWVYRDGKYCYIVYPNPPEVEYPPRWNPEPAYQPRPTYRPTYVPQDHDDDYYTPPPDEHDDSDDSDDHDDDDYYTPPPDHEDEEDHSDEEEDHSDEEEHVYKP